MLRKIYTFALLMISSSLSAAQMDPSSFYQWLHAQLLDRGNGISIYAGYTRSNYQHPETLRPRLAEVIAKQDDPSTRIHLVEISEKGLAPVLMQARADLLVKGPIVGIVHDAVVPLISPSTLSQFDHVVVIDSGLVADAFLHVIVESATYSKRPTEIYSAEGGASAADLLFAIGSYIKYGCEQATAEIRVQADLNFNPDDPSIETGRFAATEMIAELTEISKIEPRIQYNFSAHKEDEIYEKRAKNLTKDIQPTKFSPIDQEHPWVLARIAKGRSGLLEGPLSATFPDGTKWIGSVDDHRLYLAHSHPEQKPSEFHFRLRVNEIYPNPERVTTEVNGQETPALAFDVPQGFEPVRVSIRGSRQRNTSGVGFDHYGQMTLRKSGLSQIVNFAYTPAVVVESQIRALRLVSPNSSRIDILEEVKTQRLEKNLRLLSEKLGHIVTACSLQFLR